MGKRIELSGGITGFRERNYLKFSEGKESSENTLIKINVGEMKLTSAGKISINRCDRESIFYSINKNKEYISADTLSQ